MTENFRLIDSEIPKTVGLVSLDGLLSPLLQKTEGLIDFGTTLVFFCKAWR